MKNTIAHIYICRKISIRYFAQKFVPAKITHRAVNLFQGIREGCILSVEGNTAILKGVTDGRLFVR
jgi:hypothetical protein